MTVKATDKIIAFEFLDIRPGQLSGLTLDSFREMSECITPLMETRPYRIFLLRFSAAGWQLWGTNGGTDDPSVPPPYALIAEDDANGFKDVWGDNVS